MKSFLVTPASCLKGQIKLAGDKSIAHRAVIIGAISKGKTAIKNFPANKDCLATLGALRSLGVEIVSKNSKIVVSGKGLHGLRKPQRHIFIEESGTTFRLLLGVLAGQDFQVTLDAGKPLSARPMRRVTEPLRMMGAQIGARCSPACRSGRVLACLPVRQGARHEEYPPITIRGGKLRPVSYRLPVASAQVKSALLLAGLYADGITKISEPLKTRDHTERMLGLCKAGIKIKGDTIFIRGQKELSSAGKIQVPADISSAAFFMVAAAILPGSRISIKNVSLNPSRIGIIRVLKRMGASIRCQSAKYQVSKFEPMGDITVKSSKLKGVRVKREGIPSLIDELPVLMVAACFAKGKTILEGVGELRVKETDRIRSMSENLKKMGAKIVIRKRLGREDLIIEGVNKLRGAEVRSFADHRTAMSMVIAGLKAEGNTLIDDVSCIDKSFPEFLSILKPLLR